MLEWTHRLGGANYVLWGGREGYETLLNTRPGHARACLPVRRRTARVRRARAPCRRALCRLGRRARPPHPGRRRPGCAGGSRARRGCVAGAAFGSSGTAREPCQPLRLKRGRCDRIVSNTVDALPMLAVDTHVGQRVAGEDGREDLSNAEETSSFAMIANVARKPCPCTFVPCRAGARLEREAVRALDPEAPGLGTHGRVKQGHLRFRAMCNRVTSAGAHIGTSESQAGQCCSSNL